MAAIKVNGQICNDPIAKIYRHGMFFPSMQNFMLLSLNEHFFTSQPSYND